MPMLTVVSSAPNQLLPLWCLSQMFTFLNLGEKQEKGKIMRTTGRSSTEKAAVSIAGCWQLFTFLGHLQIPLITDGPIEKFPPYSLASSEFYHGWILLFIQFCVYAVILIFPFLPISVSLPSPTLHTLSSSNCYPLSFN